MYEEVVVTKGIFPPQPLHRSRGTVEQSKGRKLNHFVSDASQSLQDFTDCCCDCCSLRSSRHLLKKKKKMTNIFRQDILG